MRVAIYFTPQQSDPLAAAAAAWLGRDAFTGAALPSPAGIDPQHWEAMVAAPRRYGFHATVKAPFRLAPGATIAEIDDALRAFVATTSAPAIAKLRLARLDGFLALVPAERPAALHAMADAVVEAFDGYREPLSEADIARRHAEPLDAVQTENLARWGYPNTHERYRFHMTLTGRLANDDHGAEALLAARFAPFLGRPLAIDGLALFVEPEGGADFVVHARHAFTKAAYASTRA